MLLSRGCSLTELVAADAEGSGNLINKTLGSEQLWLLPGGVFCNWETLGIPLHPKAQDGRRHWCLSMSFAFFCPVSLLPPTCLVKCPSRLAPATRDKDFDSFFCYCAIDRWLEGLRLGFLPGLVATRICSHIQTKPFSCNEARDFRSSRFSPWMPTRHSKRVPVKRMFRQCELAPLVWQRPSNVGALIIRIGFWSPLYYI